MKLKSIAVVLAFALVATLAIAEETSQLDAASEDITEEKEVQAVEERGEDEGAQEETEETEDDEETEEEDRGLEEEQAEGDDEKEDAEKRSYHYPKKRCGIRVFKAYKYRGMRYKYPVKNVACKYENAYCHPPYWGQCRTKYATFVTYGYCGYCGYKKPYYGKRYCGLVKFYARKAVGCNCVRGRRCGHKCPKYCHYGYRYGKGCSWCRCRHHYGK